jgi:hypothetical protein
LGIAIVAAGTGIYTFDVNLIPIEIADQPALLTPEEQAGLVEELLAEDLGALICWNLPPDMIQHLLDLGLPVIYLSESSIRHPLFVSPKGLDQAARMVGEYFAETLHGQGQVLCVGGLIETEGEDGSTHLTGIQETLRKYAGITFAHIPSLWRYEQALPQIELPCSGSINPSTPFSACPTRWLCPRELDC